MRSTIKSSVFFILIFPNTLHLVTSFILKRGNFAISSKATHRIWSNSVHRSKALRSWVHKPTENPVDARIDLIPLQKETIGSSQAKILSRDPLVYLIPNLLSDAECKEYQAYAELLEEKGRPLTLSNPPEVSLQISKLWPLPLLSLGAGIPPIMKLLGSEREDTIAMSEMLQASLPNVSFALVASAVLSFGVLKMVQMLSKSSSRTSVAAALNMEEDLVFIRKLALRVSEATNHPWFRWEAPVVTRYDPGAIFARHGDASPSEGMEWQDLGGQRVVTCICYLNTLKEGEGGETYFDKLGISVAPVRGQGLVFFPADGLTWKADPRTTHESLPPSKEKWIVQLFGRAERVPPPLGIPEAFEKQ